MVRAGRLSNPVAVVSAVSLFISQVGCRKGCITSSRDRVCRSRNDSTLMLNITQQLMFAKQAGKLRTVPKATIIAALAAKVKEIDKNRWSALGGPPTQ